MLGINWLINYVQINYVHYKLGWLWNVHVNTNRFFPHTSYYANSMALSSSYNVCLIESKITKFNGSYYY